MIRALKVILIMFSFFLASCGNEPKGRWVTTQKVEVLQEKGDPQTVAFVLDAGEICALSDKWHISDSPYKEISCNKGHGWISNDEHFKKLSD